MTSSRFWRSFLPYFWTRKYEFLATTVRTLFNENIMNQFYIRLCVKIFNQLFCLLFKLLLKYILISTFKNYLPRILTYMRTKLPMVVIKNSKIPNKRRLSSFESIASIKIFLYIKFFLTTYYILVVFRGVDISFPNHQNVAADIFTKNQ